MACSFEWATGEERVRVFAILFLLWTTSLFAFGNNYAGGAGGFAILSGDGRSLVGQGASSVSLYSPQTGAAINVFVGRHLSDYLAVQGNYIWNNNGLTLTSAQFSASGQLTYEEVRSSGQQSVIGDLLLYFRKRKSWVRPYLSAGAGVVHLSSTQEHITTLIGPAPLPPETFTATDAALRVAVGADLSMGHGWAFRYSFSETLSSNPISKQLTPVGQGNLKNFQNLFGFVKSF